jgi:hypothetical protein
MTDSDATHSSKPDDDMGIAFSTPLTSEKEEAKNKIVNELVPKSPLSSHGEVFDVTKAYRNEQNIERGTIVTDRRRNKISLAGSVRSAFNEWWRKTKDGVAEAAERSAKETPMIEKAETRRGIVQEAAQYSHIAPRDDHQVTIQKIRTFKTDVERVTAKPLIVKNTSSKPSGWTFTDTVNAFPQPETKIAIPEKKNFVSDLRKTVIAPPVETRVEKKIADFIPQAGIKRNQTPGMVTKNETILSAVHIPPVITNTVRQESVKPTEKKVIHEEIIVPAIPKNEPTWVSSEEFHGKVQLIRPEEQPRSQTVPPPISPVVVSETKDKTTLDTSLSPTASSKQTSSIWPRWILIF